MNSVATSAYITRPLCARRAEHLPNMTEVKDGQLFPLIPPFYCRYCEKEVTDEGVLVV